MIPTVSGCNAAEDTAPPHEHVSLPARGWDWKCMDTLLFTAKLKTMKRFKELPYTFWVYIATLVGLYIFMTFILWDINWLGFGRKQPLFPYMSDEPDYEGRRFMTRVVVAAWSAFMILTNLRELVNWFTSKEIEGEEEEYNQ